MNVSYFGNQYAVGQIQYAMNQGQYATDQLHYEVQSLNGDFDAKEANRLEEQSELEAIPEAQIEYGTTPEDEEQFYTRLKEGVKQCT